MAGLILLLIAPSPALASDFTPLFVWFVEIPILGFSVLFLFVCIGAPKAGLVLSSLLLVGSLFVLGWAVQAGMESAGGLLAFSLLINVAAILIAVKRNQSAKVAEPRAVD